MEVGIKLLAEMCRRASKSLSRDFYELENLQAGVNITKNVGSASAVFQQFTQKAIARLTENLKFEFSKYYQHIFFSMGEFGLNVSGIADGEKIVVIKAIDGIENFARSISLFSVVVAVGYLEDGKIISEKTVINFPVLNEIYYSEKGKGSFIERHSSNLSGTSRLRCSFLDKLESASINSDLSNVKYIEKFGSSIKIFDCVSYALVILASGKIDAVIVNLDDILSLTLFFVQESGGVVEIENNRIIATNFPLWQKISDNFVL